jgi:hypothetical protein
MKSDLDLLMNYIGLYDGYELWYEVFDNLDLNKKCSLSSLRNLKEIFDYYEINNLQFKKECCKTLSLINSDLKLKKIVCLFHEIIFNTDLYDVFWRLKTTEDIYKKYGSLMMNVIILLSGYKKHLEIMKLKKYDWYQIDEQRRNIKKIVLGDFKKFGIYGIRFSQMVWGSYFMNGKIIQCGRLQYEIKTTCPNSLINLIKNIKNYAYIHIPGGDKLEIDDVIASLTMAKKYIPKYFREINMLKTVFYTKSWLLSDDLDDILESNSNILRFKRLFKVLGQEENIDDFLNFVFSCGIKKVEYKKLEGKTSLQRGLKQKILERKVLHVGFGILV